MDYFWISLGLAIGLASTLWFYLKEKNAKETIQADAEAKLEKYQPIIRIEDEVERFEQKKKKLEKEIEETRTDYKQKRMLYTELVAKNAELETTLEFVDYGLYPQKTEFGDSVSYTQAIKKNREELRSMVKAKEAVDAPTDWIVNDSSAQGRTMINRATRLALRAFNNQCEITFKNITWKNYESSLRKIKSEFEQINNLNKTLKLSINWSYLRIWEKLLSLEYEKKLKVQQEKETLREQRTLEREDARARKEWEIELRRAEKDEEESTSALEIARREIAAATGAELEKLESKIEALQKQLLEATEKKERAVSMAQVTRAGYVYVISNIGSFGDQIFKVGMTRRLDPMDRVKELGDASVPFPFDVHAMVYTDDAPKLEKALHDDLKDHRLNRINLRREFFSTSKEQIQIAFRERFPNEHFSVEIEAEQYRLSSQQKLDESQQQEAVLEEEFPSEI